MKGAKYILTAAVIAMSSVMMTGCFKPSKDAVVESKYYQSLKDQRDKLSVQLKEEKKKTNSLNKKIKAIHATSGDQKIADYKSRVKDSRIIKVDFAYDFSMYIGGKAEFIFLLSHLLDKLILFLFFLCHFI